MRSVSKIQEQILCEWTLGGIQMSHVYHIFTYEWNTNRIWEIPYFCLQQMISN